MDLGIWGALAAVYPTAAQQRCWNHRILNVLDKLPQRLQAEAKSLLTQIPYAATREAIDSASWMHTGDLAVMDDEGYVNIVGRIKDMIIRGGENIYPREIEEFLYRHPKIQDVQVFGIPDPRYGEELCAWIRLRDGDEAMAEEIRTFCQGQIAHFKIPRHIKFVDDFPMTVTGKIQKFAMREAMIGELGLVLQKTA